ncbi:LacI family DNA-binding transcriptional regulator [Prauserella flavalba]|uniref:LacI family DNA-binding transcriptional regulator n=1 Tax=Prauserella flavalba TaxID=1477506 RepID=UPI0036E18F34
MAKDSVTIRDVAARAGVSKSTVSKYLTSTPYVSADARERIERAVAELGYRPNGSARALVGGRSRFVGVLVPSIANPYQADLLAGIERAAAPHQLGTLLAIADNDEPRERELLQGLLKSGADGVIVTSAHAQDAEVQALRRAGIPVVLAGRHIAAPEIDSVVIDNRQGARLAVDHLVELGHRQIAHIPGPLTVLDFAQRAEGYRDALREHGLEPLPLLGGDRLPDPERGREAVRALMELPEAERPTAVFAAVDWIAVGVLAEASKRGIEVPGELSVIGFDNVSFCELTAPSLSTVDAHPERIGQRAVDRLADRIASGYRDEPGSREVLAPTLVVRSSTGEPKTRA